MKLSFSYWEQESLLGTPETIIVGAGIVGLNAAIRLKQLAPNDRVVVLDRSPIGAGGSTRNAGFACFGSPTELLDDLEHMSEHEVVELVRKRYDGLLRLRSLLGDDEIGYLPTGSYELFTRNDGEAFLRAAHTLERLNVLLEPITNTPTYCVISGGEIERKFNFTAIREAIANPLEGTIDTGLMMRNLRKLAAGMGVEIFGGMDVDGWSDEGPFVRVSGPGYALKCLRLLICTNGFAAELLPGLDATPARNLVLVSEPLAGLDWNASFHMHAGYVYFRNIGQRLLIGGARHLDPAWNERSAVPEEVRHALVALVNEHLFSNREVSFSHEWTGFLGVGNTRQPLIGQSTPRVSYAVRMGGMGVAIGSAVGHEVAELALA